MASGLCHLLMGPPLYMSDLFRQKPIQPFTLKAFRITLRVANNFVLNGFYLPALGHFSTREVSLGFGFLFRWGKARGCSQGGLQDLTAISFPTSFWNSQIGEQGPYKSCLYDKVMRMACWWKKKLLQSFDSVASQLNFLFVCIIMFRCWEVMFMPKSWINFWGTWNLCSVQTTLLVISVELITASSWFSPRGFWTG